MMDFWNSTLTDKSWLELQNLKRTNLTFVLIGGWAAYLWTRLHKSKDINIVLNDFNDLETLKNTYTLKKNDHLKKYEVEFGDVDLDIYVPYYSSLAIPVEDISKHTSLVENIEVVSPELLLILKQGAEFDRGMSVKGIKDRIDIVTLLCFSAINFSVYRALLDEYNLLHYHQRLQKILSEFRDIKYLDMTPREYKLRKQEILTQLKQT